MATARARRLWPVWFALLLAFLACGPTDEIVEIIPTLAPTRLQPTPYGADDRPTPLPTEVNAAPSTLPTPLPIVEGSGGAFLSGPQRQRLALATVHIAMLRQQRNGYTVMGYGSGTLIAPTGLILTNAHVASPASQGTPEYEPDALGVEILTREDEPPAATFLARVVAVDGLLDLAVLQIDRYTNGSPVHPGDLNLPYVELGDSDQVHLGDNVYIFGFPGIGGDTITFTRGSVSGFSSEERVGNRAWIKTDATIAGGNSGGLAVDDSGRIIGVPTQASAGGTDQVVDCRVVQDTNGDGLLNSQDTCIPIGGFINALRPINLAKPLILAAQADVAYVTPFDPAAGGSRDVTFTFEAWSLDFGRDGCPVQTVTAFPANVSQITANFSYQGMAEGGDFRYVWLLNKRVVAEDTFPWAEGPAGACYPVWLRNGNGLSNGAYTLLVYAGDELTLLAEAETTVGETPAGDGVHVEGVVTDAATGRAIQEAVVIVLQPGESVTLWLDNPREEAVFTAASTDRDGFYQLPDPLERGVRYEAAVLADGYVEETGYLEFDATDEDQVAIDVALNR